MLLGLKFRALPVKAAEGYALRGDVVRQAMKEDIAAGLIPYFVGECHPCKHLADDSVATVGTTSTGAIDEVAEIGEAGGLTMKAWLINPVREVPTAFLHIDAAVSSRYKVKSS